MRTQFVCVRRMSVLFGLFAVLMLLAGCPSDSPPPESAKPVTPTLSGTVSADGTPSAGVLVVVKGSAGPPREANTDKDGHYTLPLTSLTGPYFVEAANLHSAALSPGIADVTALTELAFTDIVKQDTHLYFVNLDTTFTDNGEIGDGSSDPTLLNSTSLSQGKTVALKFIKSIYGVSPTTGTGDLFTSGFVATPTDPMAKTLTAYADAVVTSGVNYSILQQIKLCEPSDVAITRSGDTVDFCQLYAKVTPTDADPSVSAYEFHTQSFDVLILNARDSEVLSVDYTPRDGTTFSCSGTSCAGIVLGAPAADGNRPLTFQSTVLTDPSGATASLTGKLVAGTTFPALTCTGAPFYIRQDGTYVAGDCISSAYGQDTLGRSVYSLSGTSGAAGSLEVRLDGNVVASVLHLGNDGYYKCRFADCNGITLSAPDADGNRTITFDGTLLLTAQPDGSLSTDQTEQLNATVTLPLSQAATPADCPNSPYAVFNYTVSGQSPATLCIPDSTYRYAYAPGDGSINYVFSNYDVLTAIGFDSQLSSLSFDSFACTDTDCAGAVLSDVDPGTGKRTLTLTNTTLREVETGGLPGDRTLVISGSAETPTADCILNGVCE